MTDLMILLKECCPVIDFSKEKKLMTNKIIDSMDIVNIIAALENKYDIGIEFDMITSENFDSIETINAMIKKLQAN